MNTPWKEQPLRFRFYVGLLEFGRRLRAFAYVYSLEIGVLIFAVIVAALASCATEVVKKEVDPGDLTDVAEAYCKANPDLNCGHVYACQTPSDNPLGLIELCIPQFDESRPDRPTLEQAETEFGSCELSPDPRFKNGSAGHLCWWCCGEGCSRGANAYNGSYCPTPLPPNTVDAGVDKSPVPPTKL